MSTLIAPELQHRDQTSSSVNRRQFLTATGMLAIGTALHAPATNAASQSSGTTVHSLDPAPTPQGEFWPNNARLVISISMQFEAGGQPPINRDNPFPAIEFPKHITTDLAAQTWFAYGYREGMQRMLELWDRHEVKVTSHIIGEAAKKNPHLARAIVEHGHEASGHGPRWSSQYAMSRNEEREFLIQARSMVKEATGQSPIGYNCNWLRRGPNTLSLLQELGYLYHIDDVSRDEPFIEQVNGKDFVVVPYTLRNNDIVLIEGRNYSPAQFLEQIKFEFDQLYKEGATRRRLMSISAHDRISGTPQMVHAWDEFLKYAKSHEGVAFMRKDEIARYALKSPLTLRESETI